MSADRHGIQRDIEAFQNELDKLFKRPNEAPVYDTRKKLEDAISDNPRFFPPVSFFQILTRRLRSRRDNGRGPVKSTAARSKRHTTLSGSSAGKPESASMRA